MNFRQVRDTDEYRMVYGGFRVIVAKWSTRKAVPGGLDVVEEWRWKARREDGLPGKGAVLCCCPAPQSQSEAEEDAKAEIDTYNSDSLGVAEAVQLHKQWFDVVAVSTGKRIDELGLRVEDVAARLDLHVKNAAAGAEMGYRLARELDEAARLRGDDIDDDD